MGVHDLPSRSTTPAFLRLSLFAFFLTMSLTVEHALAATRHYKFDVCIYCLYICITYFIWTQLDCLIMHISIYTDQTAKCDTALPHKEHGDCQRTVSRTTNRSERRWQSCDKSGKPCQKQYFHPLAWNSTASNRLGGWTRICDTVPHSNWTELCLQFHHCWPKRNSVLACPCIMAKIDCLWSISHPSQD